MGTKRGGSYWQNLAPSVALSEELKIYKWVFALKQEKFYSTQWQKIKRLGVRKNTHSLSLSTVQEPSRPPSHRHGAHRHLLYLSPPTFPAASQLSITRRHIPEPLTIPAPPTEQHLQPPSPCPPHSREEADRAPYSQAASSWFHNSAAAPPPITRLGPSRPHHLPGARRGSHRKTATTSRARDTSGNRGAEQEEHAFPQPISEHSKRLAFWEMAISLPRGSSQSLALSPRCWVVIRENGASRHAGCGRRGAFLSAILKVTLPRCVVRWAALVSASGGVGGSASRAGVCGAGRLGMGY